MIGTWFKTKWWAEYALEILPTGSRVICVPPPDNTDEDFMLLVDPATVPKLESQLDKDGWTLGGSGSNRLQYAIGTMAVGMPGGFRLHGTKIEDWTETKENGRPYGGDDGSVVYKYRGPHTNPQKLLEYPDFTNPNAKGVFNSWKKDRLNLIVTCSREYYENFSKATKLAKRLNLREKSDRVVLFHAICHDDWDYQPRAA